MCRARHRARDVLLRRGRPRRRADPAPDRVDPRAPRRLPRGTAGLLASPGVLRRGETARRAGARGERRAADARDRLLRRGARHQDRHAPGRARTSCRGSRDGRVPPARAPRRRRAAGWRVAPRALQPVPRRLRRHQPGRSLRRRARPARRRALDGRVGAVRHAVPTGRRAARRPPPAGDRVQPLGHHVRRVHPLGAMVQRAGVRWMDRRRGRAGGAAPGTDGQRGHHRRLLAAVARAHRAPIARGLHAAERTTAGTAGARGLPRRDGRRPRRQRVERGSGHRPGSAPLRRRAPRIAAHRGAGGPERHLVARHRPVRRAGGRELHRTRLRGRGNGARALGIAA